MQMYQNLGIENPEAEFYLNELKKMLMNLNIERIIQYVIQKKRISIDVLLVNFR